MSVTFLQMMVVVIAALGMKITQLHVALMIQVISVLGLNVVLVEVDSALVQLEYQDHVKVIPLIAMLMEMAVHGMHPTQDHVEPMIMVVIHPMRHAVHVVAEKLLIQLQEEAAVQMIILQLTMAVMVAIGTLKTQTLVEIMMIVILQLILNAVHAVADIPQEEAAQVEVAQVEVALEVALVKMMTVLEIMLVILALHGTMAILEAVETMIL